MPRLLLAVAAALVILSGCESAESEPDLAAVVDKIEAAGSARFSVSGTTENAGQTVPVTGAGAVDFERKRWSFKQDWDGSDSSEINVVERTTYTRSDPPWGDGMTWYKTANGRAALLGGTVSLEDLLTLLRAVGTDIRRIGEENVRGVATVEYRFDAYCSRIGAECDGATMPVAVWIDELSLLRRVSFRDLADTGTVELYDFGADIVIEAPPADEVVDIDKALTPQPCEHGYGAPITVEQVGDHLVRAGFVVARGAQCTPSIADSVWHKDRRLLYCFLYASAPPDAPTTVTRSGADSADAQLELHNLTCTILVDNPDREATIEKLEAAFDELERTVRP